ncbi:MAG: iron-sulfur cluster repair di-iron protein [Geosporobacter ferrireducens]|nr:iron-sulfur cluster repair di-iron protein [Geosporobacter ferrireducens]
MKTFNKAQKIGEIATIFPKATEIFMAYEIDFCCGGDRALEVVIKEQNIHEEELLGRLNDAYAAFDKLASESRDWRMASSAELIDFIVNKHHTFMREELPTTEKLLNKILRVHYVENGEILSRLHKLFNNLKSEIEEHLIKEEEILFPLIKKYEKNPTDETKEDIFRVMNETENEHDKAGDILKEMRKITDGYQVPELGCSSFERTYEKLKAIESDLFHHIHLENNILFETLK